jgi:hypothetical protein
MEKLTIFEKLKGWSVFGNYWFWFHILGGGALARVLVYMGRDGVDAFTDVLVICVLWEMIEYAKKGARAYGSLERFFYDAFGDVAGAMACAALVIW